MWRIRSLTKKDNKGKPKYWSEEYGWTWLDMSDVYSEAVKQMKSLPKDGVWEEQE